MSHEDPARQLTLRAVLLSIILTVILAAANAYLGLFAGMTVATAIPAAVVAMGVLRLLGRVSILENNIVATGASAGSSIAAGTIFTIPAIVLLGHWERFDYWWVLAIAGLGGVLGVLFSVPLRRTLILEQKLKFPEGVATAEVLKVSADPGHGLKALGLAALAGAAFKTALSGLKLAPEAFTAARFFGERTIGFFGLNLSPALLAVGYIVGLNIGVLMLSGGVLSWWVFIPVYNTFFFDHDPALAARLAGAGAGDAAFMIWSAQVRYIGVGAMLVGGLWSLWTLRGSLFSGVKSGLGMASIRADVPHTERDLPMSMILAGIVLFVLPLFALYYVVVDSLGIALAMAVIMLVAGFVFSSVSGYMAGLVGSSNNPVSGITISTILFASLVLLAFLGRGSTVGPVAAVLIGAVICNSAAIAGDNLQDLKAGQLVGATPWRQQVMLAIGAVSSAAVMAPVLNLLLEAYGIGTPAREGVTALPAPQATLMASVAKGIFGGGLPWDMIAIGAAVGVVVIIVDEQLKRRHATWRAPILAVAVGIYLPLELSTPIFAGGVLAWAVDRWHSKHEPGADLDKLRQTGLLFAAGLIAGEAILGVLLAIPIVATGDAEVIAVAESLRPGQWAGLAALTAVAWWMYRSATRGAKAA
ncbi:MAG: oligopeptide transporter, OPT family [Steroidobacteraceae bacterium]|jgi:putative OPT family oligopeptide transporter|nr:oligopeptide transporter, OPT family [Steroidobacteraceae bacterium]